MSELSQAMKESSRAGAVLGFATIIFGVLAMIMPMVALGAVGGMVADEVQKTAR
jgi:uncharacterized membrane protein HdeD (DUF308 family)